MAPGNPGPFLRTIALPIHEVLDPTTTATDVQQPPDRVGWVIIDDPRGRRSRSRQRQRTVRDGLEQGHVEGGVHPKGGRELQTDSTRVNNRVNLEGSNKTGGKLLGFHSEWEVFSRQPNPLPGGVKRSRDTAAVGVPLRAARGTEQGSAGTPPGVPAAPHVRLDRGDR